LDLIDKNKLPLCYLCNSLRTKVAYHDSVYRVIRCCHCGLHFVNPMSVADNSESHQSDILYNDGSDIAQMDKQKVRAVVTAGEITNLIKKGKIKGRRLLDIGSGFGFFLNELKKQGWEVFGCEQNKQANEFAGKTGLKVYTDLKDEHLWKKNCYDVITLWNVLEHIDNPLGFLCELKQLIANGGAVVIRVPNMLLENITWTMAKLKGKNSPYMDLPMHLFGFTVSSLKLLLEKAGYHDVHLIYSPLGDKAYSLKKRYGPAMGQVLVRLMEYLNLFIFHMPFLKLPGFSSITMIAYASKS